MTFKGALLTANDFTTDGKDIFISKKISKGMPGMLLIKADWCGHCKKFKSVFNQMCDQIGTRFACTSIDSDILKENPKLSEALNFKGFPTIKIFNAQGKIMGEYQGERDADAILDYACKVYDYCMK